MVLVVKGLFGSLRCHKPLRALPIRLLRLGWILFYFVDRVALLHFPALISHPSHFPQFENAKMFSKIVENTQIPENTKCNKKILGPEKKNRKKRENPSKIPEQKMQKMQQLQKCKKMKIEKCKKEMQKNKSGFACIAPPPVERWKLRNGRILFELDCVQENKLRLLFF